MKVLSVLAVAVLLAMPALHGCSMMPQSARHEVVPVKQDQILRLTIVEGKTTKKEIIDAFGTPSSVSNDSLTYYRKEKVNYQIHLIQNDGTELYYEIKRNGKSYMTICLDKKSNYQTVSHVNI